MIRMKERLEVSEPATDGFPTEGGVEGAEDAVGSNRDTLDYSYLEGAFGFSLYNYIVNDISFVGVYSIRL